MFNFKKFKIMKKLEDFECKKVEVKTIYGGRMVEVCPDTCTIITSTHDGRNDGADCD